MANYPKRYNTRGQQQFNGPFQPAHYQNYQAPTYGPQMPAPPAKKSGAVFSIIKKGNFQGATIINAWNKSRKGLITATVAPYKKSDEVVTSEKGNEYQKMMAKVFWHNTGNERLIPCLMNTRTKVVVLSEIGMVITQNGSGVTSGGKRVTGYFGTMKRR